MPEMQTNAFKRAIAQGKLQIGLWSSLCSNIAAEVISDSGFDWILLDTEHSPNEIPDLVAQLQAIQRGTAAPIIRPAWNDAVMGRRPFFFPMCRTSRRRSGPLRPRAIRRKGFAACRLPPAPAVMAACPAI
jgi:4-hydroxy-2-oxoheptanedioate aldolase